MDLIWKTISYTAAYMAVGGSSVFIGTHLGNKWNDRNEAKWSLLLQILLFGFVIYNLRDFLSAGWGGASDNV